MTDLRIRPVPESDLDKVLDLADTVFHHRTDADARERLTWLPRRAERVGAYEGDELVGFLAAVPLRLSVPGGELDCAGVTLVGVLPTHRRRGVLTAMIDRLWETAAERGQPLAALYAAEAAIYGRFGFGVATRALSVEVDSSRPLGLRVEPDPRPLRMVPYERAAEVLGPLYERAVARRPGQLRRAPEWWSHMTVPRLSQDDEERTIPRVVVLDGDPGGYAIYRTRHGDEDAGTPAVVHLEELEADDARVHAALWRYLVSIDLTEQVKGWSLPVDEPLPLMAADPDQVTVIRDRGMLWLRLVDVPAALAARGWATTDELVLRVHDDRLPANQGTWRLRTRPGRAQAACERVDAAPDLTLDVRDLGSIYLGGFQATQLVRTGIVTEHTPDAAARLDAALAVPLAPFCADDF
ncbi:GNAT family N-acetyltransferase [Actinomadura miaoliensis]|uniref:Amikacin resistance N-acetyltransferase Eis2 n=1 Tax=Actinomadura miaoliensis TaxID=430685 RepID=A0ABP7VL30_9ACTN